MATAILLPKLGLTMEEGTVVSWYKAEGEEVKKGDPILEIETDKLTNEVEAPADGVLLKIITGEGETVPVSATIGYIGETDETVPEDGAGGAGDANAAGTNAPLAEPAPAASAQSSTAANGSGTRSGESSGKVKASPVAKKLAGEKGVDLSKVMPSGSRGRIQKEDVEAYIAAQSVGGAPAGSQSVAAASAIAVGGRLEEKTEKLSSMRKTIAQRLSSSWLERPHVTESREMDMSELLKLRAAVNERSETKTSFTDYVAFLALRAIEAFPGINVSLSETTVTYHGTVNLGVAVALENGLTVPVVHNADGLAFMDLHAAIAEKADRARENKLGAEDLSGGTFTITNLGMYGVDTFSPIINPPESAILGVGRTVRKPAVVDDRIEARPMAWFSLSFDHRVIDGALAAEFLGELDRLLQNPALAVW
jgi:pyruvate dehydrogenase E2 component (dihydrolipoamide acetyltransferase)